MFDNAIARRRMSAFFAATVACILVLGVAGCSGGSSSNDSGTTAPDSVHFSGIVTSSAAAGNGTVQLNVYNKLLSGAAGHPTPVVSGGSFLDRPGATSVAAHSLVTIQGSFFPTGGSQASFAGQLESSTGAFTATGAGYTVAGTRSGTKVQGTLTNGTVTSSFSATQDDAAVAKYFCGTWTEMSGGTPTGVGGHWNFVVQGSTLVGAVDTPDGLQSISGTVDTNGTVHIHADSNPTVEFATGTVSGTSASGTYAIPGGSQGTWTSSNNC